MATEKYNGWTNYETWLLNLWFGDDEFLRDVAVESGREGLQAAVEEVLDIPETGFMADITNATLGRINWQELAEHYQED